MSHNPIAIPRPVRRRDSRMEIALALEIEPHYAEEAEQIRRKKISDSRRGETVENVTPSQKSRDQSVAAPPADEQKPTAKRRKETEGNQHRRAQSVQQP